MVDFKKKLEEKINKALTPETSGSSSIVKIQCTLNNIVFQKEDFIIATFNSLEEGKKGFDGIIKAKGNMTNPIRGNIYTLMGTWEYNSRFGKTLKFSDYEISLPVREKDVISYLSENGFGVGPATASKLVNYLSKYQPGKSVLQFIKEEPIGEIIKTIKEVEESERKEKGERNLYPIRTSVIEALKQKLIEIADDESKYFQVKYIFEQTNLNKKTIRKIMKDYGGNLLEKLKQNPYALIDVEDYQGIGFKTADRIAHNIGFNMRSNERYIAGIVYVLQEMSTKEGHTYISRHLLNEKLYNEFRLEIKEVENCLKILEISKKITIVKDRVYLSSLYNMERYVAEKLYNIMNDKTEDSFKTELLPGGINYLDLQLDQRQALDIICNNKVSILTGCPGTGKSYTLKAVIENYKSFDLKLCAPTGKAAKRMQELSGVPITFTIHKLLEPQKTPDGKFEFTRTEDNPIEADFIIVDEVSMVGIDLIYHLLKAVSNTTKLLFIGDSYQLPSISPGLVLSDMINSKKIPSCELSVIKRQDPGRIITNCHAIKNGQNITVDNNKTSDFFLINKQREEDVLSEVVELFRGDRLKEMYYNRTGLKLNNINNIQIISPHNTRTKLSCEFINNTIQQSINSKKPFIFKTSLKEGDKVVNTKNNYEIGILNGDIGIMLEGVEDYNINETLTKYFKIKFLYPEREILVPVEDHHIKLAYSLSVHKLQGSSAPIIIMPFLKGFSPLLMMRNLLYTAVSRAEKIFIGVGHINTLPDIIKRVRTINRNSTLKEFLIENFNKKF